MLSKDEYLKKWAASGDISNSCVVRVTNKCDQKCDHCCFRSGPKEIGQISIATCKKINEWLPSDIFLNIMGGEFSILSNYREILTTLSKGKRRVRLITNGFWAKDQLSTDKFYETVRQMKGISDTKVEIDISSTIWHKKILETEMQRIYAGDINAPSMVVINEEMCNEDITPVGRAWDNRIIPTRTPMCFCGTSGFMTITEDGMLYKCPFAYFPWKHFTKTTWHDARKEIWGWRAEELAGGMTCQSCMKSLDQKTQ